MAKEIKKIKVVIFGCQQIAVDFVNFLIKQRNVEISLVITYELPLDQTYGYASLSEACLKNHIPCIKPNRVTNILVDKIEEINPDIIFSVYYRKILPEKILHIPKNGCYNIHPSILPFYRGPVPTAWAILNGEKYFGITIHKMDKGIDTGDILVQKKYKILDNETGFELYNRGMKLGAILLINNFNKIIYNKLAHFKQIGIGSYYGKRKGVSKIDWQQKAENIQNLVRVHAKPYNPAETKLLNRYLIINKVKKTSLQNYITQGPGIIIEITKDQKLIVSCADGLLLIEDFEIYPKLTKNEHPIYLKKGNRFDF